MKRIEMTIQCPACNGTGVYVGMAERDGAAVVCHRCNGSGKYDYSYEYEEFTGIKKAEGVERVYKKGYGFVIAPQVLDFTGIGEIDMGEEGVSYAEFLKGNLPGHTKKLACPMVADQSVCHRVSGFVDECEALHGSCLLGTLLTKCNYQPHKANCWKRFDRDS